MDKEDLEMGCCVIAVCEGGRSGLLEDVLPTCMLEFLTAVYGTSSVSQSHLKQVVAAQQCVVRGPCYGKCGIEVRAKGAMHLCWHLTKKTSQRGPAGWN